MVDRDPSGRVLAWLTGILFSAAVFMLLVGYRQEDALVIQVGWLACGMFLLMPAILLRLRPSLAMALLHTLSNRTSHNPTAGQKTQWQQLTGEEKAYIVLIAAAAAALGAYILVRALRGV